MDSGHPVVELIAGLISIIFLGFVAWGIIFGVCKFVTGTPAPVQCRRVKTIGGCAGSGFCRVRYEDDGLGKEYLPIVGQEFCK